MDLGVPLRVLLQEELHRLDQMLRPEGRKDYTSQHFCNLCNRVPKSTVFVLHVRDSEPGIETLYLTMLTLG
eukprot:1316098-Amphidinium_carterae.1